MIKFIIRNKFNRNERSSQKVNVINLIVIVVLERIATTVGVAHSIWVLAVEEIMEEIMIRTGLS
jgi:hypothetical protein